MLAIQPKHYDPIVFSPCWQSAFLLNCKRIIDVVSAFLLLVILLPFLLVLAILVKISSPGPIFYRWRVVGKGGEQFVSYKFRSMVCNADDLKAGLNAFGAIAWTSCRSSSVS